MPPGNHQQCSHQSITHPASSSTNKTRVWVCSRERRRCLVKPREPDDWPWAASIRPNPKLCTASCATAATHPSTGTTPPHHPVGCSREVCAAVSLGVLTQPSVGERSLRGNRTQVSTWLCDGQMHAKLAAHIHSFRKEMKQRRRWRGGTTVPVCNLQRNSPDRVVLAKDRDTAVRGGR